MTATETPARLSIIVPCYNEEATVIELLQQVAAQRENIPGLQVIVVDDGSRDRTRELLDRHPELYDVVIHNPTNLGKGGAVIKALERAEGTHVLFQDADLEYRPEEYAKLMAPVVNYDADIVMGSRLSGPPCTRVAYFWHKAGNRLITLFYNLLFNTTFTDVYSCYLLFRRELVDSRELQVTGWGQHAEILGLATRRARRIYEVSISYYGRSYEEGKKIRWHHVFDVLLTMVRVRFRS